MPQSTSPSSSPPANPKAITGVDIVSLSLNSASKPLPTRIIDDFCPARCAERCKSDGEKAADRPATTCGTPQTWELQPEVPDFDFSASPGTEEWRITETADGRAVYSTVGDAGAGVTRLRPSGVP